MKTKKDKLEGFIDIDDENVNCSMLNCKEKVIASTVFTEKIKGLNVDKYNFWCKEHYKEIKELENECN